MVLTDVESVDNLAEANEYLGTTRLLLVDGLCWDSSWQLPDYEAVR
ncbi:MAG: hypothetical protein QOH55_2242 [Microbacteriaceae bacterium]|jgi:hypothetical protein|nr:hypothetical protein [Microbacteriaceae bacterium]